MAAVLSDAKCKQKAAGGKPNTLSVENQLLMVLEYWREYRTYFHIGQAYGIRESAAYRNIKWCENTLAKRKSFRLPGRKAVAASNRAFDVVLIDATETPIERPKKQRRYYSGKNKRHTLKTQLVVEKSTRRILCIENPLAATDKARNRATSSERVPCENVIAMLKRFKIIADRYRNRRRRFGLRFFLIAAIYNMELKVA